MPNAPVTSLDDSHSPSARFAVLAAGIAMASAVLACGSGDSSSMFLHDVSGAAFHFVCSEAGACKVSPAENTPAPLGCGAGTPTYALVWDRLFEICDGSKTDAGWEGMATMCRLVACQTDGDCPHQEDLAAVCRAGLCQSAGSSGNLVRVGEAIALCLDAEPRPRTCEEVTAPPYLTAFERVEDACSGVAPSAASCAVPGTCRQP